MSEEIWVKCEVCGKGFDNYPALVAHLYGHIPKTDKKTRIDVRRWKRLLCPFCGAEVPHYDVILDPLIEKEMACCSCERCKRAFVIIYIKGGNRR